MSLPKYTEMLNPVLSILSDGKPKDLHTILQLLKGRFNPSADELNERIQNGTPKFNHRMNWAIFDLVKAKLVERKGRGVYIITDEGRKYFSKTPNFTLSDLLTIPEYKTFRRPSTKPKSAKVTQVPLPMTEETPQENLEDLFDGFYKDTVNKVLEELKSCSPEKFEQICLRLLVEMGYGGSQKEAYQLLGKSHDEGLDGVIKMDKLGLENVYIQAKRWNNSPVGREKLQQFIGAIEGKATKGVMMTTSHFTKEALDLANQPGVKKMILIDGEEMAKLMVEYNLGVEIVNKYVLKRVDKDFFSEDDEVV